MAALALLLRRASSSSSSSSAIPIASRSHGSSPFIPIATRSPGSSFRPFLPFSTTSATSPALPTSDKYFPVKFGKWNEAPPATPEKYNKVHAEFPKTERLIFLWETKDGKSEIEVKQTIQHDCSETGAEEHCLRMHIKFQYRDNYSRRLEFDVADDKGQIAVQNVKMSVDDHFREYFQVHMKEFVGLLGKRGSNLSKLDFVVKYAEKLKEFKNCIESNSESAHGEFSGAENLTVNWESKDGQIEILVNEKTDAKEPSLMMRIIFCEGDEFGRTIKFDVADDKGQIAIQNVAMSVNGLLSEPVKTRLEGFERLLEKRGFNHSNLDFLVKYAEILKCF